MPPLCVHLGPVVEVLQGGCAGCGDRSPGIPVYDCQKGRGPCTPHLLLPGLQSCRRCPDHTAAVPVQAAAPALAPAIRPLRMFTLPLPQGAQGHFQGSLCQIHGKLLLATRHKWGGADVYLLELHGPNYQPRNLRYLSLQHQLCKGGREDPRLFTFAGQPHLTFTGLEGGGNMDRVHQLVAKLDMTTAVHTRRVQEVWCPHYERRQPWEKNWAPFEADGRFYVVYSIDPHIVLEIRGTAAVEVGRTPSGVRWDWGLLRGGAPPVRVGNEFYHWFHGKKDNHYYTLGLYTFEARPPFRILRFAQQPFLFPDHGDNIVFPCGALLRDGKWVISYGYQDRECRLAEFAAEDVERCLHVVGRHNRAGFETRPGTVDADVLRDVAEANEYRLPERMDGQFVLDIGGHIGSFALACAERGAAEVWSIEAEPGNLALCRKNLGQLSLPGMRTVLGLAVTRNDRPASTVRLGRDGDSEEANTGANWVGMAEGVDVPAVAFDALVEQMTGGGQRRLSLVKLDCEGSEWAILQTSRRLDRIDAVCGEYHQAAAGRAVAEGCEVSREALRRTLEAASFVVEMDEERDGRGHFWARRMNHG